MGDTSSSIPQKGIGTLNAMDWVKGLGLALGTSVIALGGLIISNHWRIPPFAVLEPYLDTIAYGFLAYIGKSLSTNNVGQLFQRDKPVVHVNAAKLASLEQIAASVSSAIPISPITTTDIQDGQPLNDDVEVKKN